MKLLIIAPEIKELSSVRNFSGVWSYYLSRELRNLGVELVFDAPLHNTGNGKFSAYDHYRTMDMTGIDHVLALGTRYFDRMPKECAMVLRRRFKGAVTQVHDTPVHVENVDCTFALSKGKRSPMGPYCVVGWAADPELCAPRQDERVLGILVDHSDYVERRGERSNEILKSATDFIESGVWRLKFDEVRLRRITDGAIIDHNGKKVGLYKRKSIPFEQACKAYGESHLFMVTHPESVGLTVLETAMAGALPMVPNGYVPKDRLATIRHIRYGETIPWVQALDEINVAASREVAMKNSWKAIAGRMVAWFLEFRR